MSLAVPVPQIVEESEDPLLQKADHWQRVRLGDIAKIQNGYAFSSKHFNKDSEGLPLIRIRDVGSDNTESYYSGEYAEEYVVETGDLLIGMDGDFEAARWQGPKGLLNQRVCRVTVTENDIYEPALLDYVLQGYLDAIHRHTSSVTVKHLSSKSVANIPLPYPPPPEQRRIVAKIEELFSNLDAGMADLQAAGQQLERYRLSVLQAAVEGRLTADWRRTHDPDPANQLLKRILEEHRKQWEVEYRWRRYDAKGKEPPSGWKDRYSSPEHLEDESNLFPIPENWEWVRSEQICGFITKGTTPKSDKMHSGDGEVPFVKVYNLTETGELDFTVDPTFVDRETHTGKLARSRLLPGDVVMNIVGPPLGQVSVVPDDYPEWNMNQAVVRYRPLDGVDRRYLTYALRAKSILNWAIRKRKATAGQFNLTLAICRDLPIPLPPLPEQKQIVDEVERLLSVADDAAATADREHTRAERLRQSILKQAFSGRLVPHVEDASPPSIDGTTPERSDSTTSDNSDSDVDDLLGSTDPDKQIEMDL